MKLVPTRPFNRLSYLQFDEKLYTSCLIRCNAQVDIRFSLFFVFLLLLSLFYY